MIAMHPFSAATAWAEDRAEPKRGTLDAAWYQGRGVYGGITAALLLKASATRIDDPRCIPRSLTVHFCAAAEAGPVEIKSELVRQGSRVSHTRAEMTREGKMIAFSSATFGTQRDHWIAYDRTDEPHAPPPSEAPPAFAHPMMPVFTQFFDMRFCVGAKPFSGAQLPETGGYVSPKEPLVCDAALAAAMLDVWPPAAMALSDTFMNAASVDFTVHFFEALPLSSATPDDEYLVRVRSNFARDGYAEELREMWAPDGRYIAQCRQLFALF